MAEPKKAEPTTEEKMDAWGKRMDALCSEMDKFLDGQAKKDKRAKADDEPEAMASDDDRKDADDEDMGEDGEKPRRRAAADAAEENKILEQQTKADHVMRHWGKRAPQAMMGEPLRVYRRRLASMLKQHSPIIARSISTSSAIRRAGRSPSGKSMPTRSRRAPTAVRSPQARCARSSTLIGLVARSRNSSARGARRWGRSCWSRIACAAVGSTRTPTPRSDRAVLVRNVGTKTWHWPWGDDGPERVEPGQVIDVETSPPPQRNPGETSVECRARLAQRRREGCPRIRFLRALWLAWHDAQRATRPAAGALIRRASLSGVSS
jgi:hypothetical protein